MPLTQTKELHSVQEAAGCRKQRMRKWTRIQQPRRQISRLPNLRRVRGPRHHAAPKPARLLLVLLQRFVAAWPAHRQSPEPSAAVAQR